MSLAKRYIEYRIKEQQRLLIDAEEELPLLEHKVDSCKSEITSLKTLISELEALLI